MLSILSLINHYIGCFVFLSLLLFWMFLAFTLYHFPFHSKSTHYVAPKNPKTLKFDIRNKTNGRGFLCVAACSKESRCAVLLCWSVQRSCSAPADYKPCFQTANVAAKLICSRLCWKPWHINEIGMGCHGVTAGFEKNFRIITAGRDRRQDYIYHRDAFFVDIFISSFVWVFSQLAYQCSHVFDKKKKKKQHWPIEDKQGMFFSYNYPNHWFVLNAWID